MPQPPKDPTQDKNPPRGGPPPRLPSKASGKSSRTSESNPRWRNAKGQFTKRDTPGSKPAWKKDN